MPEQPSLQPALEAARTLEQKGRLEEAVRAFQRAGAVEEAARVLARLGRHAEASRLILDALGVEAPRVNQLPAAQRKLALRAALYAGKGGDTQAAVEMLLALGEDNRAAELLDRVGETLEAARVRGRRRARARDSGPLPPDAARAAAAADRLAASGDLDGAMAAHLEQGHPAKAAKIAHQLGRLADAGRLFAEAGRAYEAARCFREARDVEAALDSLARVPRSDPQYRQAAADAVTLAGDRDALGVRLEQFLSEFISTGPVTDEELPVFYALAEIYLRQDFPENAEEVFQKIFERKANYRDVRRRLAALREEGRRPDAALAGILQEDARFWRDPRKSTRVAELPGAPAGLPELPALPAAGPLSPPPGTPRSGTAPAAPPAPRPPAAAAPASAGAPPVAGTTADSFREGGIVADRYRIAAEIGRGGMATVYRATDLELGEEVALKVFRQPLDDDAALARFKQELRLSRRLVHPNIARLYDIGVHLGHRYISMELLVGRGLDSQMGRPLELRKGVGYLLQACAALQAAHNEGVVHRDVKPANMFVTVDEHVKVMDFGIAKQREARGMTVTGMVIGTPEYMSPEQIRGFSSVTEAADIYALGVVAYEMFTGTVPFKHDDLMPLLMMQLESAPEPPRYRNGAITPELETVILQLLQKDPRQRFASCDALAEALRRLKL